MTQKTDNNEPLTIDVATEAVEAESAEAKEAESRKTVYEQACSRSRHPRERLFAAS